MHRGPLTDFYLHLMALVLSVVVVHAGYLLVIRPGAAALMATSAEVVASTRAGTEAEAEPEPEPQVEAGTEVEAEVEAGTEAEIGIGVPAVATTDDAAELMRSPLIVLKDVEQEICLILMLWALLMIALKIHYVLRARRAFAEDLLPIAPGHRILPDDVRQYLRPLLVEPAHERGLIARALVSGLQRFGVTAEVPAVVAAVHETIDVEADRLDAELAMLRYIVWAIPSIGFIGTVRGIGDALGQAQRAIDGDIAGVTASLGVAFNSTFVALLASMVVMFLMYQLQLLQERLIVDAHAYCDETLVQHLAAR